MRQKRAKLYKRAMATYINTFAFRQPFQILVSQDVLLEGAKSGTDMPKQFVTIVQGECKPMLTQCCIEALYKLGKSVQKTINLAKSFERRKCNHRTTLEPDACLKDVIGVFFRLSVSRGNFSYDQDLVITCKTGSQNKHNYILAAQSISLIHSLQNIPGLPIIHYNPRGVLVLSPPSVATVREKLKKEEERRLENKVILDSVVDGANVFGVNGPMPMTRERNARKVKAPNPLSVKKKHLPAPELKEDNKKRSRANDEDDVGEGDDMKGESKRKRRRKKKKSSVAEAIMELNVSDTARMSTAIGENSGEDRLDNKFDPPVI
nr:U3 small nucleolar RNA-associated protein 23 [Cryptococcus depauperatus CBS 7855]